MSLVLNLQLSNLNEAEKSLKDLEYIGRDFANTYVLKAKCIMQRKDQAWEQKIENCVSDMERCSDYQTSCLLAVLDDLLECDQSSPLVHGLVVKLMDKLSKDKSIDDD